MNMKEKARAVDAAIDKLVDALREFEAEAMKAEEAIKQEIRGTPQGPNKGRAQRLSTRKQTDPVFKRYQLVREAIATHEDLRPNLDFHRDARRLAASY